MEKSTIAWTDNTFNPWIGCSKVSRGCQHCYAEAQNKLRKWNGGSWGPGSPRSVTSPANWAMPLKWNKAAAKAGTRTRVFCASLADVFDPEAPTAARERLWELIQETTNLDWLILSKRPENFAKYLPADWGQGYANVWLGVTCEDRKYGLPRVELLRNTPASLRFVSAEPLLEDISSIDLTNIDWLICGGESGHHAREFQAEWARALRDRCADSGVAFFLKQLGSKPTEGSSPFVILNSNAGKRDIHGKNPLNFPNDLRVQTWPVPKIEGVSFRDKLQQAMDVTPLGAYHRTADAIMSAIPEAVVGELSVNTLAILITAMNKHWHDAIAFAERAACTEGGIWDATRQTFRELKDGR
jgi:protein gp37